MLRWCRCWYGRPNGEARRQALELLEALDVAHRARAMPSQLSGGEQQRVSIARALAVIRFLNQMALQYETAIIVVTHDEKIIPSFKRIYTIRDGQPHEEAGEARPV